MQRPHARRDPSELTNRDAMMARIDRLESLLVSAMSTNGQPKAGARTVTNGDPSAPNLDINGNQIPSNLHPRNIETTSLDVDGVTKEFGSMKVDQAENSSIYLGGVHWVSIMSEVSCSVHLCDHPVD